MQIRSFVPHDLPQIIDCMLSAFSNYFVPITGDLVYWEERLKAARVDYGLSFGIMDEQKLVAFIIQGIGVHQGEKTAFNTGTGVIASHRGQAAVDQMYQKAIPLLTQEGITKCMLEVIQENHRAIRVYERIGFSIRRELYCYKGSLTSQLPEVVISPVSTQQIKPLKNTLLAWDNMDDAIQAAGEKYKAFLVSRPSEDPLGHFIINPSSGTLAQFEAYQGEWAELFGGIRQVSETLKINNIDSQSTELLKALPRFGLENHVNQFEMEMPLSP